MVQVAQPSRRDEHTVYKVICSFDASSTGSTSSSAVAVSDIKTTPSSTAPQPLTTTASPTSGNNKDNEDVMATVEARNATDDVVARRQPSLGNPNTLDDDDDVRADGESDTSDRDDDESDRRDDSLNTDDEDDAILDGISITSLEGWAEVDRDLRRASSLFSIDAVILADDDTSVSTLAATPDAFTSFEARRASGNAPSLPFGEGEMGAVEEPEGDDESSRKLPGESSDIDASHDNEETPAKALSADASTDIPAISSEGRDDDEDVIGNNPRRSSSVRYAYPTSLSGIPEDNEALTPLTQNRRTIEPIPSIDNTLRRHSSATTSTTEDDSANDFLLLPSPSSLSTASISLNSYPSQDKVRFLLKPCPGPRYLLYSNPDCNPNNKVEGSYSGSRSCYSFSEYGPHTREEYKALQSILSEDSDNTEESNILHSILSEEDDTSSSCDNDTHQLRSTRSSLLDLITAKAKDEEDEVDEDEDECSLTPSLLGVNSDEMDQRRHTQLNGLDKHTCVLRY